jgi:uncharacterized membrane protein YgcG
MTLSASVPPTAPPTAVKGLPYSELKKRHDDYDATYWKEIEDFYVGGRRLEKVRADYLPRLVNEHPTRHADRVKAAGYVNYTGPIIDKIAACVCQQTLTIRSGADPAEAAKVGSGANDGEAAPPPAPPSPEGAKDPAIYLAFQTDTDGKRTPLAELGKKILKGSLKFQTAYVALDFPRKPAGAVVGSLADEDALKLGRPYAIQIPREQVIDWDEDDDGGFKFLVIHRLKDRKAPPGERTGTRVEEFKVWKKLDAHETFDELLDFDPDGEVVDDLDRAVWRLYRKEYPIAQPPAEDDIIPLVEVGATTFRRIPVLALTLDEGLWAGNKLASLAKEHWQRRTTLVSAENKTCVSLPVLNLGPETSGIGAAMPSQIQQNAKRGPVVDPRGTLDAEGWLRLGKDDEASYLEPGGAAYGLIDGQLDKVRDEMHRVVDQMSASAPAAAQASKQLQSGVSKQMDRSSEAIVYTALGFALREFMLLLHKTVSEARGEKALEWHAHGMDDYESVDRDALIAEAQGMSLVSIHSVTFKRIYETQLALALVANASPEDKARMRAEIVAGVTDEEANQSELADKTHESALTGLDAKTSEDKRIQSGKPPIAQQRGGQRGGAPPGRPGGGGGRFGGGGGRPPKGKGGR